MATKKWTLLSQTVKDHIVVPKTATNTNITRLLLNAKSDWTSVAKIINKYDIKDAKKGTTHNSVIQRVLDIKNGKITELSQITSTGSTDTGGNSSTGNTGTGSGSTDIQNDETSTGSGPLNSTVSRVPITDPVEALEWAKTEWNKIRRTSGHELECQVFGSNEWQVGEWCKVYLPTLNEYTDMYITKVDHKNDSGSEWLTNITLSDYAPSLSSIDEDKIKESGDGSEDSETGDGDGAAQGDGASESSKWTAIAEILQKYYKKPSDGWNTRIQTIREAKKYDPDIRSVIVPLTKKDEYKHKSHVDIGHEICKALDIQY